MTGKKRKITIVFCTVLLKTKKKCLTNFFVFNRFKLPSGFPISVNSFKRPMQLFWSIQKVLFLHPPKIPSIFVCCFVVSLFFLVLVDGIHKIFRIYFARV